MKFANQIRSHLFLSIIFFSSIIQLNSQNSSQSDLVDYYSARGDFHFLSIPNPQYNQIDGIPGSEEGKIDSYTFEYKTYTYGFGYYRLVDDEPLGIKNEDQLLLDKLMQGALEKVNAKPISVKNIFSNNIPGREFIHSAPSGLMSITRIYLKNLADVYLITVTNEGNHTIENNIVYEVLNSFGFGKVSSVTASQSNSENKKVYAVTWCLMAVICDPYPNPNEWKDNFGLIPYIAEIQVFQYHYEKQCGYGEVFQTSDSAHIFFNKLVKKSEFDYGEPYNKIVDIKIDNIPAK